MLRTALRPVLNLHSPLLTYVHDRMSPTRHSLKPLHCLLSLRAKLGHRLPTGRELFAFLLALLLYPDTKSILDLPYDITRGMTNVELVARTGLLICAQSLPLLLALLLSDIRYEKYPKSTILLAGVSSLPTSFYKSCQGGYTLLVSPIKIFQLRSRSINCQSRGRSMSISI